MVKACKGYKNRGPRIRLYGYVTICTNPSFQALNSYVFWCKTFNSYMIQMIMKQKK